MVARSSKKRQKPSRKFTSIIKQLSRVYSNQSLLKFLSSHLLSQLHLIRDQFERRRRKLLLNKDLPRLRKIIKQEPLIKKKSTFQRKKLFKEKKSKRITMKSLRTSWLILMTCGQKNECKENKCLH